MSGTCLLVDGWLLSPTGPALPLPWRAGSVNKEYKAQIRSLAFNLRDVKNPNLRSRVLHGELTPVRLAVMDAGELASTELSQWRAKRSEEAAKNVFLDTGGCTGQCGVGGGEGWIFASLAVFLYQSCRRAR